MTFSKRTLFAAVAIAAAGSFLLCGYEFIRAVSTSLFIEAYGKENLPWVMAAIFPGVYLMIYIYGRLLSWFGARGALVITSFLSAAVIVAASGMILRGYFIATAIIYILREAYIVVIIEQYWSFVNSTLNPKQARWINGPFCAIASMGSITGGMLVERWAVPFGSERLLLFAAGSLIPAAICAVIAYTVAGEPQPTEAEQDGKQGHTGLKVFSRSQYLIFTFLLILTTQVVSTVIGLRFDGLVADSITHPDIRTAYYGSVYKWVGISSGLLQFIAVPLFLRWFPFQLIHLYIPLIHFVTAGLLSFSPTLRNGAAAYLIFKALDYSFFRSGKELFYIPLSYDERYRAKQIIDSFGYRSAKSGSGFLIGLLSIPGTMFAPIAMAMAVIWTGIVAKLTVQYQKLEERITS